MPLNSKIMTAVEQLSYRVTVGDVATQAGLDIQQTERGLLALASEVSGNLQVSETGDIAYLFPRNFRSVLRNKYWRLRLQALWAKIWPAIFYLIRISFGIFLLVSIVLIFVAIAIILIAMNSQDDRSSNRRSGSFIPRFWITPDLFWFFNPNPRYHRQHARGRQPKDPDQMNVLEAIFSFLFGDGNPNANLEDRRWQAIGSVIRNNGGAVTGEQLAPYLEVSDHQRDSEDYVIPVLTHFDGRPEVSPQGEIIYHFPTLQSTAKAHQQQSRSTYLQEYPWKFSQADSGQILLAIGLGGLNLVGAAVLWSLLRDGSVAIQLGGLVGFVYSIFGVLVAYGIGFLGIPLLRYFWIQGRNRKIEARNQQRQACTVALSQLNPTLQQKIRYAQTFSAQSVISSENLAYTTEKDLLEQEYERSDTIDAEWQRRLNANE
ncbi:hypothetical protein [Acaryochloris sp. IP29b_bin.148]|uniref:hypothetical protein n=1 Tax=Acaryochloris sp. IP29b_bin.148 TaxID=2969218 RepID=UPI0026210095|nr:hypothetical protein [Acaryochloris sp. IP29b_bin.148]